jgi:hypothetical protein
LLSPFGVPGSWKGLSRLPHVSPAWTIPSELACFE